MTDSDFPDRDELLNTATFLNIAFDPASPYNDLPMLPPMGVVETTDVLKQCITARSALATLEELCRHFRYQAMLQTVFPVLEAYQNCAFTQNGHSVEHLLQLNTEQWERNANTRRVNAARQALDYGYELIQERQLDSSMMQEFCGMIVNRPAPLRRECTKNDDTLSDSSPYVPPQGAELLQRLLSNWQHYLHVDAGNVDPLVLMAVAHYQFQAIRPFAEENGTLARLIDSLLLAEENLLSRPVLGLGAWYLRNREQYARLHSEVTVQQNWHAWIAFVLKGVSVSAQVAINRLRAAEQLAQHTDEYVRSKLPAVHSTQLVDVLFSSTCVRIQDIVKADIARRQTASVYLKKLCSIGVLEEVQVGKEKLFIHSKFLRLVTRDSDFYTPYNN